MMNWSRYRDAPTNDRFRANVQFRATRVEDLQADRQLNTGENMTTARISLLGSNAVYRTQTPAREAT